MNNLLKHSNKELEILFSQNLYYLHDRKGLNLLPVLFCILW
jgi:hypothetical protein